MLQISSTLLHTLSKVLVRTLLRSSQGPEDLQVSRQLVCHLLGLFHINQQLIRELLKETGLCVVKKVTGVQGEHERRRNSALRDSRPSSRHIRPDLVHWLELFF